MAAQASSPAPVLPTLPLPRELTALLADHAQLSLTLSQHEDLLARLASLREARAQGHDQMNVPVDLGRGYMVEGVVRDTSKVFVLGLDDLFMELEVDKAEDFILKKCEILKRRVGALDEPIARLKKDYALVTKTLRTALELPDEEPKHVT